jgi:hypothetical protein
LKEELLKSGVIQADETTVSRLAPGEGKTHRSYLWSYVTGAFEPMKAVVYDFTDSRSGQHAREFLGDWRGLLVCDDFSGYKALFALGVTEAGCMAHARRKFVELHVANKRATLGNCCHIEGWARAKRAITEHTSRQWPTS